MSDGKEEGHVETQGAAEPTESSPTRLVWDSYLGRSLAQAPGRMQRRELTDECPFCADRRMGRAAPDAQAWMRPNDFPPLVPPVGECYILIYSPDHDQTFARMSLDGAQRVIGLWRTAYQRLSTKYQAIMTWETCGAAIGQTQRHPHGQTYGLAVLPDTLTRELAAVESAQRAGAPCPFCEEALAEREGPRLLAAGEHWTAFIPAYARYPYQTHLIPQAHYPSMEGASSESPAEVELARLLLTTLRAYERLFQAPMPYMLALHQLADERFHFHIEILPVGRAPGKLKLAASSEAAWGFWLNDSLPEEKAVELRAAMWEEASNVT